MGTWWMRKTSLIFAVRGAAKTKKKLSTRFLGLCFGGCRFGFLGFKLVGPEKTVAIRGGMQYASHFKIRYKAMGRTRTPKYPEALGLAKAVALFHNNFFMGLNKVYQPSRWQMILPPLLQWTAFLTVHNIGASCFGASNVLQTEDQNDGQSWTNTGLEVGLVYELWIIHHSWFG